MFDTPAMVDMRKTTEEKSEATQMPALANEPDYDYGLRLCLNHESLEKLDVDVNSLQVGETYHLFCLAKVTSISKNANDTGENCRVEMTLTHIGAESEDEENEGAREAMERPRFRLPYAD